MKARKVFQVKSSKEKQYSLLSYFRAFFLLGLCREGTEGGSCFEVWVMGKLICSDLDGCGPKFLGTPTGVGDSRGSHDDLHPTFTVVRSCSGSSCCLSLWLTCSRPNVSCLSEFIFYVLAFGLVGAYHNLDESHR
jgi:hypothetical protein